MPGPRADASSDFKTMTRACGQQVVRVATDALTFRDARHLFDASRHAQLVAVAPLLCK
jgi:hypothetical protein